MERAKITPVESGNRVQLPVDWLKELGIEKSVLLDRKEEGILVRRCSPFTWDEIFASKLVFKPWNGQKEDIEVTKDDLLF
jgi:hypothetical protein